MGALKRSTKLCAFLIPIVMLEPTSAKWLLGKEGLSTLCRGKLWQTRTTVRKPDLTDPCRITTKRSVQLFRLLLLIQITSLL